MELHRSFNEEPISVVKNEKDGIVGYGAVFNKFSEDLGGYREVILPGAFDEEMLNPNLDVVCRIQHEGGLNVIGRTTNNTLFLEVDEIGLKYTCYPAETQSGRDIITLIRDGFIFKSSFAFGVREEDMIWDFDSSPAICKIRKCKLYDVAPVDFPAYPDTSVTMKSFLRNQQIRSMNNKRQVILEYLNNKQGING